MDSLITAAARALQAGDPLGALERVALRNDPPALALRGVAMAQLGELGRARQLLRRAARGFGPAEVVARARCVAAEAEVALASRDLTWPSRRLAEAIATFAAHGKQENRRHAELLRVRRLLLLGDVAEAEAALASLELPAGSALLAASGQLLAFEIALRQGRTAVARTALAGARRAALDAGIPALGAEIEQAGRALELPAARLEEAGETRSLVLAEVEALLASADLVVDACRRALRGGGRLVPLARRPVLFALLRALARAWPGEATRARLIEEVFGARRANASHRARLRVEIGRLRKQVRGLAEVRATPQGFVLVAPGALKVRVLLPPIEGPDAAVLALLADGAAWSTSALALALGSSQRSVQRALGALEAAGKVRGLGEGRARRWTCAPTTGITPTLLLPAPPL